ncbi:hypothetical protein C8E87_6363 [Paractinoplanes brasiliensis]|uniref:Uncharacterized protein n=1 Tax=Paractinoplanes brasiliensis TaxID=52695 RepID=A0A4R6K0J9_9ACTN|nr:hypothetical protein C8E87_6363 [Actinoplanes brasiliensis]
MMPAVPELGVSLPEGWLLAVPELGVSLPEGWL